MLLERCRAIMEQESGTYQLMLHSENPAVRTQTADAFGTQVSTHNAQLHPYMCRLACRRPLIFPLCSRSLSTSLQLKGAFKRSHTHHVYVTKQHAHRQELKDLILNTFDGVTYLRNPPQLGPDNRPLNTIVHRLCQLVDRSVTIEIQIVSSSATSTL
jgi:hypothetical protein